MNACIDHGQPGNSGGYGSVWFERRRTGAHRAVLARKLGTPLSALDGLVARHTCDNPRCINPEHLELGTHKDNSADMVTRGRHRATAFPGMSNHAAKLTDEQARAIRQAKGRVRQVDLAAEYGVTQGLISRIQRGAGWTHLA